MRKHAGAKKRKGLRATISKSLAGIGAVLAHKFVVQPWHVNWGATEEEVQRIMPGDGLMDTPDYVSTRAVSIRTKPEDIYPLLVKIGQEICGNYGFDCVESFWKLNLHESDEFIPEIQNLDIDEMIPVDPKETSLELENLIENRSMTFYATDGGWTWDFEIYPVNEGITRFVSRNRFSLKETELGFRFFTKLIAPGTFIKERKMLLGIKKNAESRNTKKKKVSDKSLNVLVKAAA